MLIVFQIFIKLELILVVVLLNLDAKLQLLVFISQAANFFVQMHDFLFLEFNDEVGLLSFLFESFFLIFFVLEILVKPEPLVDPLQFLFL